VYEIKTEEAKERFLDHVRKTVKYWQNLTEETVEARIEGVAFSILAAIDGVSDGLPKFTLAPDPHPDDRMYRIELGLPWWPENYKGCIVADISGQLHEDLYEKPVKRGEP